MKISKKWHGLLLILSFIGSMPVSASILHEQTNVQMVTKGVEYTQKSILSEKGWQDIYILKVDLNTPYLGLKSLESPILGEKKTVLDFAKSNQVIAAVNGDFFSLTDTLAPSLGAVIEEGTLKHTYHYKYSQLGPNKNMATLLVDTSNNVLMDFFGLEMALYIDGEKITDICSYNNLNSTLSQPLLVDGTYYASNAEMLKKYAATPFYTVVIENNIITKIASPMETVAIGKEARAILFNAGMYQSMVNNLQEGILVSLEETIALNNDVIYQVNQMKLGLGGGGLIFKNGMPYTGATHQVSPNSGVARTILATTQTVGELFLIAVDGTSTTTGATHGELVTLLTSLGVKDAMYLDGGGSTTFVARTPGNSEVSLLNNPTDTSQRRVTNALGVYTTAPIGELENLQVTLSQNRTFVGETVTLSLVGTDVYGNPKIINPAEVKLSTIGLDGKWEGVTFTPQQAGHGLLVVKVGEVETAVELTVTAGPKGLVIEPTKTQVNVGATKQIKVYGIDSAGYKIPIDSSNLTYTGGNNNVHIQGDKITGKAETLATFTANYGGTTASFEVVVGKTVVALESFETLNGKWAGNTSTVTGEVKMSTSVKYHGNRSLLMKYTFDKSSNKQIAYTLFETPITIPTNTTHINLWAKSDVAGDVLKLQLVDAKGKTHYIKLSDSLLANQWQYLSGELPNTIVLPAKVQKLYAYSNNVSTKRTTMLYIDHLSVTKGSLTQKGRTDYFFDGSYKAQLANSTAKQYDIKVIGQTASNSMLLGKDITEKINKKLSVNSNLVLFASPKQVALNVQVPTYTYDNTFKSVTYNETLMIFLGTDSGGLRKTNANQWIALKQTLENSDSKHILLVMSKDPLTQFDDIREGEALHDYLRELKTSTGKSIFVITPGGTKNEVRLEDGIRYMTLNGAIVPTDDPKQTSYVRFKVVDGLIYYTFESLE